MKTHALRHPALPLRAIASSGAILLLTAFAPPEDRPPPPALAQQVIPQDTIPRSWIPEFPKKEDQPLTFRSTPQVETAIAGDTQLGPDCPIAIGEHWGEVTGQADTVHALVKAGQFDEALAKTIELMRLTQTSADHYLVLTMFGSIYEAAGNRAGQAEALRALLAGNCFLIPGEKALLQKKLDALGKPSN
jgi:hypothetical protein